MKNKHCENQKKRKALFKKVFPVCHLTAKSKEYLINLYYDLKSQKYPPVIYDHFLIISNYSFLFTVEKGTLITRNVTRTFDKIKIFKRKKIEDTLFFFWKND
jgi:hypothetical protein